MSVMTTRSFQFAVLFGAWLLIPVHAFAADAEPEVLAEAWSDYVFAVVEEDEDRALVRSTQPREQGNGLAEREYWALKRDLPHRLAGWAEHVATSRMDRDHLITLTDEAITETMALRKQHGRHRPPTDGQLLYNRMVNEALDVVEELQDPDPDVIAALFEGMAGEVPDDVDFEHGRWEVTGRLLAQGRPIARLPVAEEDFVDAEREGAENFLFRVAVADKFIGAYQLMESSKLRSEVEQLVAERGNGEDPERVMRAILREREWTRFRLDRAEHHVVIHDPELEGAVYEIWKERRDELRSLRSHEDVMDRPWYEVIAGIPPHEAR